MAKRDDKRVSEWRETFWAKARLMDERCFVEVTPEEFYRDLFPAGSLEVSRFSGEGKGTAIVTQVRSEPNTRSKQWVIHDDLKNLEKGVGDEFGLIAPISFFGKTHSRHNAHELYAIAIDIDYVGLQQLKNLLKQFKTRVQLSPTYLVSSGKGVHLYYFLKEPIPLYANLAKPLSELKEAFIRRLWNDTSSLRPNKPDITGIYQAFRCVGSLSKLGPGFPVMAWRVSGQRYTLADIRNSIPGCHLDVDVVDYNPSRGAALKGKPQTPPKKKKIPLEQAKVLYPEWYERKIVQGLPNTGHWMCKRDLYDWWKRKIQSEVKEGGRYFSLMALCAYGLKCGVDESEIRKDAFEFLTYLDSITEDSDNHFTSHDVESALKTLRQDKRDLTMMSTRAWIENHTKVDIPANKRNGRKQDAHLKMVNATRKFRHDVLGEQEYPGRPTKQQLVQNWRAAHPNGRKIDCQRDTGMSRPTVLKWWNADGEPTDD